MSTTTPPKAGRPAVPSTTTSTVAPAKPVSVTSPDQPGLYLIDRDGTNLRRVSPVQGFGPVWSPDGRSIAFIEGDHWEVHVIDPATGADHKVAEYESNGSELPSWSPDSTRIAYSGNGSVPDRDIWIADATGRTSAREIAWPGDDSGIAWGPDGRLATFGSNGLWVLNPDGSGRQQISTQTVGWGLLDWSADGQWLSARSPGTDVNLMIHPDGSGAHNLGLEAHTPTWSPDGKRIVSTGREDYAPGIVVGPASGGPSHLIAQWLQRPVWSPTGDLIAAVDNPDGNNDRDIVAVAPDGTGERLLTRLPPNLRFDDTLNWSPDGRTLAFTAYTSPILAPHPRPIFGQGARCGTPTAGDGNGVITTAKSDDYEITMVGGCLIPASQGGVSVTGTNFNGYLTAETVDYGDGTSWDVPRFSESCPGGNGYPNLYLVSGASHPYNSPGEYTITYTATMVSCAEAHYGQTKTITLTLKTIVQP